ncbi:protein RoBo-1-like isoform X1 [Cricetulus griseus]|uniref:protein RoBo-1-like isoform X1 n=1 Tax=Cricetulus griseus TaxID=10029 RepID=UPI0007DA8E3C|nr:protein RoBo-1-like isoform X1 [Cricetulus griseus]
MVKQKYCLGETDTCGDLSFSATLGDQRRFRYESRCCTSDRCNKDDITLSQEPAKPNGIQCIAYYSELDALHIPTSLTCTGAETKCITVIGTVKGSSNPLSIVMAGMGCATESACNLNMTILDSIDVHTFCLSGLPVFPPGSSVPDRLCEQCCRGVLNSYTVVGCSSGDGPVLGAVAIFESKFS